MDPKRRKDPDARAKNAVFVRFTSDASEFDPVAAAGLIRIGRPTRSPSLPPEDRTPPSDGPAPPTE